MTLLLDRASAAGPLAGARAGRGRQWLRLHRASLLTLAGVLAVVGAAMAWNLQGWPGRVNDDEGTYVAQAWAMLHPHHLSHYTYWYDHPPLGWAAIAAHEWLTAGFRRDPSAVMAGRELMWLATLASCAVLYLLGRRLGLRRATTAVTVGLFGLSPLAIFYHRMVSLDNLATAWLFAALAIAASRRRGLAAAFWSAACAAAGVLTKETIAIQVPIVVWVLCQHADRRTRRWNLAIFAVTFVLLVLSYPLFAVLRGELLPGPGHVSLGWALWWQFAGRSGSGSVLDPHSAAYHLAHFWLGIDAWLLVAGLALVPTGLMVRRLRPFAIGLAIQVAVMVKGGYLPYFYVTAMLPFAALLIGGIADTLWTVSPGRHPRSSWRATLAAVGRRLPVAVAAVVLVALVLPRWSGALRAQSTVAGDASSRAATAWIERTIPKGDVVVVDDYMWTDLKLRGWNPLWLWKTDGDPQVTREVLPHGYRSIQYVVLAPQATSTLATEPTLKAALDHSVVVKDFGDGITARRVTGAVP